MPIDTSRSIDHPKEVIESMCGIMRDIGVSDPSAFFSIWQPDEILPELTRVIVAMQERKGPVIRNPGGLLWSRLEKIYPWRSLV